MSPNKVYSSNSHTARALSHPEPQYRASVWCLNWSKFSLSGMNSRIWWCAEECHQTSKPHLANQLALPSPWWRRLTALRANVSLFSLLMQGVVSLPT